MPWNKPIPRTRTIVAFMGGAAALVLLMSACGGSSSAMPMPSGGSPAPASGPAVHTGQVSIRNFAFGPSTITVVVGTKVTWTNEDGVEHVILASSAGFKSPVLNQGDAASHTFSKPGTYYYICSIHPFMHGTVVVTAT
jgi:plastocyanin